MTLLQMIAEWRKGCSCSDRPENCSQCTLALIDALERELRKPGANAWGVLDMDGEEFHSVHTCKEDAERAAFGLGTVVPLTSFNSDEARAALRAFCDGLKRMGPILWPSLSSIPKMEPLKLHLEGNAAFDAMVHKILRQNTSEADMQVVPNISVKTLKDCVEGELVIVPTKDGPAAIGIVATQESCRALIFLDRLRASSALIDDAERLTVGSMGVDYRVEVDADCASFSDRESVKNYPGWLNATAGGWEMVANQENGDWYRFKLPLPMSGNASKLSNNKRVIFPRWSIVIERKTVFKFDATVE